jgi:hypothetical protein
MKKHLALILVMALLLACLPAGCRDQPGRPTEQGIATMTQITGGRARTEHLIISYPEGNEDEVGNFVAFAEDVYADVNLLFENALPNTIAVDLVDEPGSRASATGITVSLQVPSAVEQIYAHELAHIALREIIGERYELEEYRFLAEGLAAWVEERYEPEAGFVEPRACRAAYAHSLGLSSLRHAQEWEELKRVVGDSSAYSLGHSFVSYLDDEYGRGALVRVVHAAADASGLAAALRDAGVDDTEFVEGWQAMLDAEAAQHDFDRVPQVEADLVVAGSGPARDVSVRVRVENPEATEYKYYVAYYIGDVWKEDTYDANASNVEALVPLGQVNVETLVRWDAVVWSDTLKAWVKSGWQKRTIE